ncbi:MAG: dihydrodipicolinate synthase family protein, partial [Lentisphaerae bacterium]|nr:dihydrodipicolinate synthase family protein [Lentisphaerota bacterium]
MHYCGIIPAVPTPFTGNDEINYAVLRRLLEFLLRAGVQGIFLAGNAGEAHALEDNEKRALLRAALKTLDGRLPVIFGAGAPTTRAAIRLAQMAEAEGAQAISIIAPYPVKPARNELQAHFRAVARKVKLPILLYNNPALTGVAIPPKMADALRELPNIIGIKDSSGDLALTMEFLRLQDGHFRVFAGRDGLILATLMQGGAGAVSAVAAACPETALAIYRAWRRGDLAEAALRQEQ